VVLFIAPENGNKHGKELFLRYNFHKMKSVKATCLTLAYKFNLVQYLWACKH